MQKHAGSFDFILDAVSADHDVNAYLNLLALNGNLMMVGARPKPLGVSAFSLIFGEPFQNVAKTVSRKSVADLLVKLATTPGLEKQP